MKDIENGAPSLGPRLRAAAGFIRRDAVFADIGTDHALLPIWAVKTGAAGRAIASDINTGPLLRARENVRQNGCSGSIECVLSSGFDALDSRGITDAAICGMGGELIAKIVGEADFIKRRGFRLIIQPMTMQNAARRGLWQNGFGIESEITVFEDGKYYTVICADYTGQAEDHDEFYALYGDLASRKFEPFDIRHGYFKGQISKYERIIKGKGGVGLDVSVETDIVRRLSEVM